MQQKYCNKRCSACSIYEAGIDSISGVKIELPSWVQEFKMIKKLLSLGFSPHNNFHVRDVIRIDCKYATIDEDLMFEAHTDDGYSDAKGKEIKLSCLLSIPDPLLGFDRALSDKQQHLFSINGFDVYANIANLGYETDGFSTMRINSKQRSQDLSVYKDGHIVKKPKILFSFCLSLGKRRDTSSFLYLTVKDTESEQESFERILFNSNGDVTRGEVQNISVNEYFFNLFLEEYQKQSFKMILTKQQIKQTNKLKNRLCKTK